MKLPTAYIVLPHCTSCRTCWTGLSLPYTWGVSAGDAETGPVCAAAAPADAMPSRASAAEMTEADSKRETGLRMVILKRWCGANSPLWK